MNLPIDVVPNTSPPRFFWTQVVQSPVGPRAVGYEGVLPSHVESAVTALIALAKRLETDNMVMHGSIRMAVDRLGGMVEGKPTHEGNFLQRVDELVAIESGTTQAPTAKPMNISTGKRKG